MNGEWLLTKSPESSKTRRNKLTKWLTINIRCKILKPLKVRDLLVYGLWYIRWNNNYFYFINLPLKVCQHRAAWCSRWATSLSVYAWTSTFGTTNLKTGKKKNCFNFVIIINSTTITFGEKLNVKGTESNLCKPNCRNPSIKYRSVFGTKVLYISAFVISCFLNCCRLNIWSYTETMIELE